MRGAVVIGHDGPIVPAEAWTSWNLDPLIWSALVVAGGGYWWASARCRRTDPWPARWFAAGLAVAAVALLSPLDAMSASLGSAHMVQHVLLTMVAVPLIVLGAPVRTMSRALPRAGRRRLGRWRAGRIARSASDAIADPVLTAGVFVVVLWVWHARGPYQAALESDLLHGIEHATFFLAALASWAAILPVRRRRGRSGIGVLVLFGLSVQCGLLGALLTFATEPWYPAYESTTAAWGLSPLADQQLSGVIMWVPAGGIYLVAALLLLRAWLGLGDVASPQVPRRGALAARGAAGRGCSAGRRCTGRWR